MDRRPETQPPPKSARKPKRRWVPLAAGVTVVALLGGGMAAAVAMNGSGEVIDAVTYEPVVRMDLDITVRKDGELQSVNSTEVVSRLEGNNTIVELVEEGTFVRAGDLLVRLDSSGIEREFQETELELQGAENDLINATEQLEIEKEKVEADIEAATVALTLAEMDLRQYEQGVYPQLESNARTAVEMAKIDLRNAEEELLQTQQLFSKNFATGSDVKRRELTLIRARNALEKAQTDYDVLTEYTHPKDLTSKRNVLAQRKQQLARVQRQGKANISRNQANVKSRELRLLNRQERMDWCEQQLAASEIRAPIAGLVVYGAAGNQREQDQITEGASVRERQTIIRLPDTQSMKAVVKISESRVGMIELDQSATLMLNSGGDPIDATVSSISVVADSNQRWFNPDVREYPVELLMADTPEGLKPGMKVNAEIFIDRREDVIAVPLGAVYTVGSQRFVFKRGDDGRPVPVEVEVAASSTTHAEIVSGVDVGDEVVLLQVGQGRDLLEAAGIDPVREQQQNARDAADKPADDAGV
ncbi:MAG: HlyD family efflux transporter periplasmic adaptor subunit [Planctomycetota bacterium]